MKTDLIYVHRCFPLFEIFVLAGAVIYDRRRTDKIKKVEKAPCGQRQSKQIVLHGFVCKSSNKSLVKPQLITYSQCEFKLITVSNGVVSTPVEQISPPFYYFFFVSSLTVVPLQSSVKPIIGVYTWMRPSLVRASPGIRHLWTLYVP